MTVDTITLQIFANHVRAAAENMAYTLHRTAHSTFVKETQDFTTQITDAAGYTVGVPFDIRRDVVSRHLLWPCTEDDFRVRAGATLASPTIPTAAFSRRTCPTCTCGSRFFMRVRLSLSPAGMSITRTWVAPCRRAYHAR